MHTFHYGQTYPVYGGTEKKGGTLFRDVVKSEPELVDIIRFLIVFFLLSEEKV